MTRRPKEDWRGKLIADAAQTRVRHRPYAVVQALAGLGAILLIAGLVADLVLGSPPLALLAYAGAGIASIAMGVWYFSKRLRRTRPPRR
jgi:lysozyme family protein